MYAIRSYYVNENAMARNRIRKLFVREAVLQSNVIKGKELEGQNYLTYYEWKEDVMKSPPHRVSYNFV